VWSNCFVNGAGVAHGAASLTMHRRNEAGIPSNCMYRVMMDQCESVADVLSLCDRVPVMHHPSHNVFADDTGCLLGLELTPLGTYVCQPPGQAHVPITNHFCPGPYEDMDSREGDLVANSRRRFDNLQRLSASLPQTLEGMLALIRDHSESGQICQHGNDSMWSSTGYVAIPSQRRMLIGRGQPCEAEFVEVGL
jgi:hypothetical protein